MVVDRRLPVDESEVRGIEFVNFSDFGKRFSTPSAPAQVERHVEMAFHIVRRQLNRVLKLSFGSLPVPFIQPNAPSKCIVSLAEGCIESQRLVYCFLGALIGIFWG